VEARAALIRVAVISPEPTPYRAPLFDRIAAREDIDLSVLYASESVVGTGWRGQLQHRARFLRGFRLPGAVHVVRHDYPVTPGVVRALQQIRPDVVVISGWSTFASQAALAWCRLRSIPYVLLVESHDRGPRAGWRRMVKDAVVPWIVRGAARVLVVGSLARESMVARGARPDRIRIFANTIDVSGFRRRAEDLGANRAGLRTGFGLGTDDVAVVCVARFVSDKGLDVLVRAAAAAGPDVKLLLVGDGPERRRLEDLANTLAVNIIFAGELPWERVIEAYVASDVFALLSLRETWGVVVNEAAATGLPLVLSGGVGAAPDLLRDGENGYLVRVGDADAAAVALAALARDATLRRRFGDCSRGIIATWGYEPSIESFVEVVQAAAPEARRR
jgi:glycosyltransferase involved in cell wall biosynthesis